MNSLFVKEDYLGWLEKEITFEKVNPSTTLVYYPILDRINDYMCACVVQKEEKCLIYEIDLNDELPMRGVDMNEANIEKIIMSRLSRKKRKHNMKFLITLTLAVLFIGCVTPGEISDMKTDTKAGLENIRKISEVVKANIGSEDDAKARKTTIEQILRNFQTTTVQVKNATAAIDSAAKSIKIATAQMNNEKTGIPEIFRKLDNNLAAVQLSIDKMFGKSDQDGLLHMFLASLNKTSRNIEKTSSNVKQLTSTKSELIKNLNNTSKNIADSTDKISKNLDVTQQITKKIEAQFASDKIPKTLTSVQGLAVGMKATSLNMEKALEEKGYIGATMQNIQKSSKTFGLASIILMIMAVLQVICFIYLGLMLYRANRQYAKSEIMQSLRALSENIMVVDGVEKWKIPSRNIIYRTNLLRLFDQALPILQELHEQDGSLISEFVDKLCQSKRVKLS